MRTSTRRLIWLLLVAISGAAAWLVAARPNDKTVTLRRRTPLVGVVPIYRPSAPRLHVPDAGTAGEYVPTDRIVSVEISEYAGYAGIIVANGGLEPSEDSLFFRDHNFRVRLTVREEQDFTNLNAGRLGASMTTADVVAIYGTNLNAVVPVLVGFSRGADGIVTRREITSFDGLKGKIIATAQFTEADFLVRYLATHTGAGVNLLASVEATPDPNRVNMVFAESTFDACDMLLAELVLHKSRLSACSAWEPRTSGTVQRSGGAAHFLMTNRNLFIVADVLAVNRALAEHHPEMVQGLVDGILSGNKMVQDSPEMHLSEIGTALNWSRDKTRSELAKVQLATMPENLEFFSGATNEIGTFAHIYQSALAAYGDVVTAPAEVLSALDMRALRALEESGRFPVRSTPVQRLRSLVPETDPVVSLPTPEIVPQKHVLPNAGGAPLPVAAAPGKEH